MILDAGARLDTGRHVDGVRLDAIDRLAHVRRRQSTGENDSPRARDRAGAVPVDRLARAALGDRVVGIEQDQIVRDLWRDAERCQMHDRYDRDRRVLRHG
jgi:hypothetical protein